MSGDAFFPLFLIVGLFSPICSIVGAVVFYVWHSERVGRANRIPVLAYILVITICGVAGGYLGLSVGIAKACGGANADNLCGLWGFLVTGPVAFAASVLLASGIFALAIGRTRN